jgi:hypothetical protein
VRADLAKLEDVKRLAAERGQVYAHQPSEVTIAVVSASSASA